MLGFNILVYNRNYRNRSLYSSTVITMDSDHYSTLETFRIVGLLSYCPEVNLLIYEFTAVQTMQSRILDTQVNKKLRRMRHEAVMA
jgi:hypothetical protein